MKNGQTFQHQQAFLFLETGRDNQSEPGVTLILCVRKSLQTRTLMDYKSAVTLITSTLERHHIHDYGDDIRALPRQLEGHPLLLMSVRLTKPISCTGSFQLMAHK